MAEADQDFLARYVKTRDADAFRELVEAHQDMVFAACNRILRNAADAEDAAQGCFLSLARKPEQIKDSVSGWLHRAATHSAIDLARRQRSQKAREAMAMEQRTTPEPSPWEQVADAVDAAINDLPDNLRIPVIRYYLERQGQAQIAAEMAVSVPTVSKRIQRGINPVRVIR